MKHAIALVAAGEADARVVARIIQAIAAEFHDAVTIREPSSDRVGGVRVDLIIDDLAEPSFTCPTCGTVSHHPQDVANGYCGRCHAFTGDQAISDANRS